MSAHDPHAEIRRRYRIMRRYWAKRGFGKLNERGERYFSAEMEAEALEAYNAEQAAMPEPVRDPEPPIQVERPALDLVEPGTGDLRVAILCPGPSLVETWPEGERLDGYDLVLAVNNAAEWAPCEWWVAHDAPPLRDYRGRPSVGILTSGANVQTLEGDRSFMPGGMSDEELDALLVVNDAKNTHEKAPRKHGWSTCNALVLAARLGARSIDLYGDDKQGTTYHDGRTNPGSKVARWDRERRNQSELVSDISKAGIAVRNIQPNREA